MALALLDPRDVVAALAAGEQLAQPAIGGAVARIDENVRRAVDEDEARADQKFWLMLDLGIVELLPGAHHAGQRVVVGNPDHGNFELARLMHIGARIRAAAQEGKIGGDADLGISGNVAGVHANSPCTNQLAGTGSPSASASLAAIKPVAKDPEAAALLVLDAEIIPRQRFAVLLPPFHGDAFGTFDARHHMGDAAPGELMRRAVRHGGERHLDGLGLFEQPQRTQRRLALDPLRPGRLRGGRQMMLRRHGERRALGDVGVLRQMHDHAVAADARGDAVDQGGEFVIVVHVGIEIALLLHHDFGAAGGQADEIEAETGIERIVQRVEPFAEQAVDHLGLRHRPPGIDGNRAHRAVGAEETGFQPPRALALFVHRRDQHCGERGQRDRDHGFGRDRFGKAFFDDVIRQRLSRADRRVALAQRLLEQRGETGAEPRRDFVARARGDIADGLQPGAAQAAGDGVISAERGYRQRATASASSPSATIVPDVWRVSVRAQIEVPAIAALTTKPCRLSAPHTICSSAPRRRTDGRSR